ncbi:MAG: hypothetical protein ACFFAO_11110 [Candidatus Hermodarchaeota archaeon]
MANQKKKFWTIGQIDATGVRGPHEKELEDISKDKYSLFIDIEIDKLKNIVQEHLGSKIENLRFNEDWSITIEMFPEVDIHMAYSYFGDEFGDDIEAEFKFYFSGERVTMVPGEDSATYIDIIMDFMERMLENKEPFEKDYENKTELMKKVLVQRSHPFEFLTDNDKDPLSTFIHGKVWKTSNGWRIKKEFLPKMFVEIIWDKQNGLDISFSGENLKNMSSYHAELICIFIINHALRYITLNNEDKQLPDICYIMFSRMYTKEKNWNHRRA